MHRHVVNIGLTLLAQSDLPLTFWYEAFTSASYIINQLPNASLNLISPFEALHKQKLDYNMFKIFGSSCFPLLHPYQIHKVAFRSTKCLSIGFHPYHKGFM